MRYLITGAGMLGRALAARLDVDGHEPVLFDLTGGDIDGDLRDIETIRPALKNVGGIFHTAAVHGWRDAPPRDFFEVNVTGTWNLYEAAAEAGVRRIVHSSTVGVYPGSPREPLAATGGTGPLGEAGRHSGYEEGARHVLDAGTSAGAVSDVYGLTKWLSEQVARYFAARAGIDFVALRYGGFAQIIQQRYGSLVRDWARSGAVVDLDDVVEANVQAMRRLPLPRDAYLVIPTGGTETSAYQVDTHVTEEDLGMTFEWTFDKLLERAQ